MATTEGKLNQLPESDPGSREAASTTESHIKPPTETDNPALVQDPVITGAVALEAVRREPIAPPKPTPFMSERIEQRSMPDSKKPWIIGGAVLSGVVLLGAGLAATGGESSDKAPAIAEAEDETPEPGAPVVFGETQTPSVPEATQINPPVLEEDDAAPDAGTTPTESQAPATVEPDILRALDAVPEIVRADLDFNTTGSGFAEHPSTLSLISIRPGEETIEMARNGTIYEIPRLRDPADDPKAFLESALALWACYLTSGNEECLEEFSANPDVQAMLIRQRMVDFAPRQTRPDYKDAQAAFTDRYEDPVKVEYQGNHVRVTQGSLLFGIVDFDPTWQTLSPLLKAIDARFTKLQFDLGATSDGKPTIVGLKWSVEFTK